MPGKRVRQPHSGAWGVSELTLERQLGASTDGIEVSNVLGKWLLLMYPSMLQSLLKYRFLGSIVRSF